MAPTPVRRSPYIGHGGVRPVSRRSREEEKQGNSDEEYEIQRSIQINGELNKANKNELDDDIDLDENNQHNKDRLIKRRRYSLIIDI